MSTRPRSAPARAALVLVGAGCYWLAFAPVDCALAGWLALVPVLLAVRGESPRRAFLYGALFGFASPWLITWWLAQAVAHYFGWGMPLAILAMSAAYLVAVSLPFGLFAAGASVLLRRDGPSVSFAVAAVWVACELFRARVIGQPWALLGYTQHANVGLLQLASVTGIYGVSFLVALGSAAVARAALALREGFGRAVGTLVLPALVVAAVWIDGAAGLPRRSDVPDDSFPVVAVQTNLPPAFRWNRGYAERTLLAHVRATDGAPPFDRHGLVVWPENALALYLENEPLVAAQLRTLAARQGADLLVGGPRHERGHVFNSATLLTAGGRDGGHYDKQHLVAFAEAPPLGAPEADEADESPRAFTAGDAPGVLRGVVPIGVSICHEVIYPELIAAEAAAGAELLVNISNDGWLDGGYAIASRQHMAMASVRAIETRRYLVRAATTGVSGVVDPFGRVIDSLDSGTAGVVTAAVAGRSGKTPYVSLGDAFAVACGLAAAAALARGRLPRVAGMPAPAPQPS